MRYRVTYTGFIFEGDTAGQNVRYAPRFSDVSWMLDAYDGVEIFDTQYGEVFLSSDKRPTKIQLPIAYVHLIQACLETINKHNLHALLCGTTEAEFIGTLKEDINTVLHEVIYPLDIEDLDTEIIIPEVKS